MKRRPSKRRFRSLTREAASIQSLESRVLLTDLANGQEVFGTVAIGDNQQFDFEVNAGETVIFTVGETTTSSGAPFIEIFDSSSNSVGTDFDSNHAGLQFVAETSGTFTAVVHDQGFDNLMDYRARVLTLPGSSGPGLIADRDEVMSNGEEFESTIPIGSYSVMPFEVGVGETVLFTVGETTTSSGAPFVEIFDPSGTSIGSDFDSNHAGLEFVAESTGTFTAVVFDSGLDNLLGFRARLLTLPGSSGPALITDRDEVLSNGEEFESVIPVGSYSVMPFEAGVGDTVLFTVGETTTSSGAPFVEIFDPSGASIGSDFDSNHAGLQFVSESTGTFTAVVYDTGLDNLLGFRARLLTLPGSSAPALITDRDEVLSNGEEFESVIPVGSYSVMPFEAGVGETVLFTVGETTTSSGAPFVEIFDPSGVSVGSDFDSNHAGMQFVSESTGTFTAVVFDSGLDNTLGFRARLLTLPGSSAPGLIADRDEVMSNGEEFESTIPIGSYSVMPFEAVVGERILFTADETTTSSGAPFIEVFDPSGASFVTGSDSTAAGVQFVAEATGTYTVVLFDSGLDNQLDFLAKLEKGDVLIGSQVLTISGTIDPDQVQITQSNAETVVTMDTREWTFSNSAFDSINIELFSGDDEVSIVNVNRSMTVSGGAGDDTIQTGSANDEIQGDAGDDSIVGGDGDDTIGGGSGSDTIRGNDGDDDIEAGEGNDSVIGGGGDDSIVGGDGADTLGGSVGNDTVLGGFDDDELGGGSGNDSVLGDEGHDSITGEEGDDTIFGGSGNDSIFAASGNDVLDGGAGNDSVFGGGNADTLNGSGGNDTLFGRGGRDIVFGNGGNDSIVGGGGADTLHGNSGADTLKGGRFADAIVGGPGDDSINGGDQRDLLIGSDGLDTLNGNGQNDILVGGSVIWEEDNARLADVIAEWDSTRTFAERIANLRDGSGPSPANGTTFLSSSTVTNDSDIDQLTGEGAKDWFFADLAEILDLAENELVG